MSDILVTKKSKEYELIDSGDGEKLERYGEYVLRRPELQALWSKKLSEEEWKKADAVFFRSGKTGKWNCKKDIKKWSFKISDLVFNLQLMPSKHLGVFPEQGVQWEWLTQIIETNNTRIMTNDTNRKIKVLNLFGYTGGASLACAKAGAEVCHVDASEFAVDLAHTNMKLSGLDNKKIRFIVDDVRKFVEREIKRGNKYDVVIMDPPVYGKGAKGEVWKIEKDLLPLLSRLKNILSLEPVAVVLNGYSSGYSTETYKQALNTLTDSLNGETTCGELMIEESSGKRLLSCGVFARWNK